MKSIKRLNNEPTSKNPYANHKIFIGGLQGTGKTHLAKHLAVNYFTSCLSIRMSKDFDDINHMVLVQPSSRDYADDVEELCRQLNILGRQYEAGHIKKMPYDAFVIDEADLIWVQNGQIKPQTRELLAMHRHFGIALIFITRRVQDIPPRIVETCKHMFFFKIEGNNVRKYLYNIDPRIVDHLDGISYDSHSYVYKQIGSEPIVKTAI